MGKLKDYVSILYKNIESQRVKLNQTEDEYEKVQIADIDNGNRFETYVITGEEKSGCICLNGAAAKCVEVGDKVIIMAYAQMQIDEIKSHQPKVVFVNDKNEINEVVNYEKHGEIK